MSRSWSTFFEHGCAIIIFFLSLFWHLFLKFLFKYYQNSNWSNIYSILIYLFETIFSKGCAEKKILELKTFGPFKTKKMKRNFFKNENLHNFIIFNFLLVVLILLFLEQKNTKIQTFFTNWLFWKNWKKIDTKFFNSILLAFKLANSKEKSVLKNNFCVPIIKKVNLIWEVKLRRAPSTVSAPDKNRTSTSWNKTH